MSNKSDLVKFLEIARKQIISADRTKALATVEYVIANVQSLAEDHVTGE